MVPHICLFIAFERQDVTGTAYYVHITLTTRRSCKVKPSKACKHSTEGHVCSFREQTPLPCLLGEAGFNYMISSFFPFPFLNAEVRPALGWIRALSGRKRLSVGSWILTSFTADVRGCREWQEEKGKCGRKDRRGLSREAGFCHKVSAEFWASHLIMWAGHIACLFPFLWGAQFDTLGGPHLCWCTAPNLQQKSVRVDLKCRQCL